MIRIVKSKTGNLGFPEFEDGLHLSDLIEQVASALGAPASQVVGSPFECFVSFEGYPEAFQLWWDGFSCELGCSETCGVEMSVVEKCLALSGAFATSQ